MQRGNRENILECGGEISPDLYSNKCQEKELLIKCVEYSKGERHYSMSGRIKEGYIKQMAVELAFDHGWIREETVRITSKKCSKKCSTVKAKA